METAPIELPSLRLALVGFSPAEQEVLTMALQQVRLGLPWRHSSVAEADAMFASGQRAVGRPGGMVEISPGVTGVGPILLDLNASDRPLAFSGTAPPPGFPGHPVFDLKKPESIRAMLVQFTGWLHPMAVRFWLASRIVQQRLDLVSTVYHVSIDGRLQAVISRRNGIGVLPITDPGRLADAIWARRPGLADGIPGHFVQAPLPEVLWQYAMRTTRDLLPTYFRSGLIYWCRAPQLRQWMFKDSHLMIVRELAAAPAGFGDLRRRTGLADEILARDLAALRIVGAVTQERKQAAGNPALKSVTSIPHGPASTFARHPPPTQRASNILSGAGDMTAPAPLTTQRV